RCSYCMPAEGLAWLPREEILTTAEVIRVVGVAVGLGVTEVRLTGGEPLLRMDLVDVVAGIRSAYPSVAVSLTTNGIGLDRLAEPLRDAGLQRVNVSLDTLRRDRFTSLARRDRLADVLRGLSVASAVGLAPVKVNTVLLRGVNDDEAVSLLRFCLDNGYELRFIEQMPLEPQHSWDRATMVTADEILAALSAEWSLSPIDEADHAPARRWLVDGGPATVGVI